MSAMDKGVPTHSKLRLSSKNVSAPIVGHLDTLSFDNCLGDCDNLCSPPTTSCEWMHSCFKTFLAKNPFGLRRLHYQGFFFPKDEPNPSDCSLILLLLPQGVGGVRPQLGLFSPRT